MNKRIFSLVCIVLNKPNEKNDIESKCETQLKNNNLKDDEDYKDYKDEEHGREYINEDDKKFNCFNIFNRNKKNKRTKILPYSKTPLIHSYSQIAESSSNNNESHPNLSLQMQRNIQEIFTTNPELLKTFL
ncbi:hypothetical protein YYG_04059 [Plasmodium vinckei petteri]|uniref:PYST-C1-like N-terminal domain-containing protein n=1 Tax=Plasmodium vinckei petteri TaxID=138298 RepID=W7AYI6_PLAVN|nr:hypothetical protein YYG_04059 [Plasmodium vinckei petteri]